MGKKTFEENPTELDPDSDINEYLLENRGDIVTEQLPDLEPIPAKHAIANYDIADDDTEDYQNFMFFPDLLSDDHYPDIMQPTSSHLELASCYILLMLASFKATMTSVLEVLGSALWSIFIAITNAFAVFGKEMWAILRNPLGSFYSVAFMAYARGWAPNLAMITSMQRHVFILISIFCSSIINSWIN